MLTIIMTHEELLSVRRFLSVVDGLRKEVMDARKACV
jgi:hypothetical protein